MGLLLLGVRHNQRDVCVFVLVNLSDFSDLAIRADLLQEHQACIPQEQEVLAHVALKTRFRWAIVVARPEMCSMRFMKMRKRWSSDDRIRSVSMKFFHNCQIQNPDIPLAARSGTACRGAARRSGAGQDK